MKLIRRKISIAALSSICTSHAFASESAREPVLRIASLVPRNSVYHQQLLQLGQAWRKALDGKGRFNVFTDGSQGGEAEMVKRIRIGQLQGGLLSVVGLREIEESVTAMQSIPLLFRDWSEVDYVRDKLRDSMERRFLAKGFVVLAWGDAGWVRSFQRQRLVSLRTFAASNFSLGAMNPSNRPS